MNVDDYKNVPLTSDTVDEYCSQLDIQLEDIFNDIETVTDLIDKLKISTSVLMLDVKMLNQDVKRLIEK